MQAVLVEALNKVFSKSNEAAQKRKSIYWWNESISTARKQFTDARRKLKYKEKDRIRAKNTKTKEKVWKRAKSICVGVKRVRNT